MVVGVVTSSAVTVWPLRSPRTVVLVARQQTRDRPRPLDAVGCGCPITGLVGEPPASATEMAMTCSDTHRATWKCPTRQPLAVCSTALFAQLAHDHLGVPGVRRVPQHVARPAPYASDLFYGTWASEPPDPRLARILIHTSSFVLVGRCG